MDWLRTIELSEYAPNLRGSGVHGGLIALEPGFGHDHLANLLDINPKKTLLRKHLQTSFNQLLSDQQFEVFSQKMPKKNLFLRQSEIIFCEMECQCL